MGVPSDLLEGWFRLFYLAELYPLLYPYKLKTNGYKKTPVKTEV
jgi:hypothetical protein